MMPTKKILVLGNRVRSEEDKTLIRESMDGYEILGYIPEMDEIAQADRDGSRPFDDISQIPDDLKQVTLKLAALAS